MEIWYLLITGKFLFWSFQEWEIGSFIEPKSWWKDDIYWLLKRSCFELFGDEKNGLFWFKKLKERWFWLVTEKFLFWTFRWWEIRSFFQSKCWWKDDIYIAFLSFPWYSRTWEIWFFAQCQKNQWIHLNTNMLSLFIPTLLPFSNSCPEIRYLQQLKHPNANPTPPRNYRSFRTTDGLVIFR